jgi:hypothetical protein
VEVIESRASPEERVTGFTEIIVERVKPGVQDQLLRLDDRRSIAIDVSGGRRGSTGCLGAPLALCGFEPGPKLLRHTTLTAPASFSPQPPRPQPRPAPQLAQTYYFHVNGVDRFLWESLPKELGGGPGVELPPGLRGGLEVDFLGHCLRRRAAAFASQPLRSSSGGLPRIKLSDSVQKTPHPRPTPFTPPPGGGSGGAGPSSGDGGDVGGESCGAPGIDDCALRQLLRRSAELGVVPLWLAARWSPKGMAPTDDQPAPEAMRGALRGKMGQHDPAGMLERAHRDLLLCVMFYPFKDM